METAGAKDDDMTFWMLRAREQACIYIHRYVCVCVCLRACVYWVLWVWAAGLYIHTQMCVCVCVCVFVLGALGVRSRPLCLQQT